MRNAVTQNECECIRRIRNLIDVYVHYSTVYVRTSVDD